MRSAGTQGAIYTIMINNTPSQGLNIDCNGQTLPAPHMKIGEKAIFLLSNESHDEVIRIIGYSESLGKQLSILGSLSNTPGD